MVYRGCGLLALLSFETEFPAAQNWNHIRENSGQKIFLVKYGCNIANRYLRRPHKQNVIKYYDNIFWFGKNSNNKQFGKQFGIADTWLYFVIYYYPYLFSTKLFHGNMEVFRNYNDSLVAHLRNFCDKLYFWQNSRNSFHVFICNKMDTTVYKHIPNEKTHGKYKMTDKSSNNGTKRKYELCKWQTCLKSI